MFITVDGGTMAQVFLYPPAINVGAQERAIGFSRERNAYIIRNARLDPDWANVERSTMTITQRDGVDFNLTFIPDSFNFPHKEEFDNEYMRKLFEVGDEQGVKGVPWAKTPPGFSR